MNRNQFIEKISAYMNTCVSDKKPHAITKENVRLSSLIEKNMQPAPSESATEKLTSPLLMDGHNIHL